MTRKPEENKLIELRWKMRIGRICTDDEMFFNRELYEFTQDLESCLHLCLHIQASMNGEFLPRMTRTCPTVRRVVTNARSGTV